MVELGQRRREGHAGGDADARLDGAGDHDRQADVLGDAQAGPHPAERLHLQHRDVGGLEVADPVGVLGPADRLVGGHRHVHATSYDSEVLDGHHRLLDVLQAAGRTVDRGDRADGLVDVPRAVGVDPHQAVRPERVAHRLDAGEVVGERLAALGDLDLGRAAAAGGDDGVRPVGVGGRDGDVDGHDGAQRLRPPHVGRLARAGEPRAGGRVVVLQERRPLPPAGVAAQQHALADRDATEPGAQRDGEDVQVVHGRGHQSAALMACRSTLPLGSSGRLSTHRNSRGAHDRGCSRLTQSRSSASRTLPTTTATTRWPHSGSGTPRTSASLDEEVLAEPSGDGGDRDLHAAADDDVVDAADDLQASVLVEAAGVGGEEPAVDDGLGGELGVVGVVAEERRTGDAHASLGADRHRRPRRAACRRRRTRRRSRTSRRWRRRGRPAPRRACARPGRGRRRRRGPRGSGRGPRPARGRPRCGGAGSARARRTSGSSAWSAATARPMSRPSTTTGSWPATRERTMTCTPATYDDGSASSHRPVAAQPTGGRLDAGEHGAAREDDPLRPAGRAGGLDQQRWRGVGLEPPRQLPDGDGGLVRGPQETHTTNASGSASMSTHGTARRPDRPRPRSYAVGSRP